MERESRMLLEQMPVSFFRCPNSTRVLMGADGDDKVMCCCGKTNPKVTAVNATHSEVDPVGGHAHHIKRFMAPATVDEYLAARARNEAW